MEARDANNKKIKRGDRVVCVIPTDNKNFPNAITSELGRVFTVEKVKFSLWGEIKCLVFSCHPYIEGNYRAITARASRFLKLYEEI